MFKDARELDVQRTDASFRQALRRYADAAESWFDGTPGSVEARFAACSRLLHSVRATTARLNVSDAVPFIRAASQLEADRRALVALHDDLMTGASNREDVAGPPGWRLAQSQGIPTSGTPGSSTLPGTGSSAPPASSPLGQPYAPNQMPMATPQVSPQPGAGPMTPTASLRKQAPNANPKSKRLHGPFAGFTDFEDCKEKAPAGDPDKYCGKIYHQVTKGRKRKGEPLSNFQDKQSSLEGSDRRWVTLEAAKFVAANTDTLDDSQELATRAYHHAQVKTSTFTPARSAAVSEAFVTQVTSLGLRSHRPAVVRTASIPNVDAVDPAALFL
jgi:hypothetical protein